MANAQRLIPLNRYPEPKQPIKPYIMRFLSQRGQVFGSLALGLTIRQSISHLVTAENAPKGEPCPIPR